MREEDTYGAMYHYLQMVSQYLRSHQYLQKLQNEGVIKGYATNQLAATDPMEDTRAEAKLTHSDEYLFGVYDGHGGPFCGRVLAKRLFNYIAVALLPIDLKRKMLKTNMKLLESFHDKYDWKENKSEVFDDNLKQWTEELCNKNEEMSVSKAMNEAFLRLDRDIGVTAENLSDKLALTVAMSGAVACVAHIKKETLHVAYCGDCQAVLGQQSQDGVWTAKKLTAEHICENYKEVERIHNEHPNEERGHIIRDGRLFNSLIPLRAFGDYRYKWTIRQLDKIAVPKYGRKVVPPGYNSPPYLTAKPDVIEHQLSKTDKFLILGSDGLWDCLSPEMTVQLVADHWSGRSSKLKLLFPKFEDMFQSNDQKPMGELIPEDENVATHLIRAALGGNYELVSRQLSFPKDHVRIIRDDITVTVIFLRDLTSSNPPQMGQSQTTKSEQQPINDSPEKSKIQEN